MFNNLRRRILQDAPGLVCHPAAMKSFLVVGVLAWCLAVGATAELKAEPVPVKPAAAVAQWPAASPEAVAHWRSLRFGMFIHWGPVSLTGKEIGWSRGDAISVADYDHLYQRFNPSNFNADAWVSIARAAGMKYIVLTTKHHDGFCLWDTKETDYNIMNTPFHRDVVKELAAACKRQGIAFGAYYSTCDWHHPDFPLTSPGGSVKREKSDLDAYNRYLLAQVRELIVNYGPLITIWNDVPQRFEGRGAATIKLARQLQPDILINDRTGDGGDYDTPEQRIGKYQFDRPWESCMTVSAHNQWAWGGPADGVKPVSACLDMLIRCAGGDGNMLLNVGPRPDGVIDPAQAGLLREIGAWLQKNGESIYGTRGGPWKPAAGVVSTRRDNLVYVHVLRADGDTVALPDIGQTIQSASLLDGRPIRFRQSPAGLELFVPAMMRDRIDTVVKLVLAGSAMDLPAVAVPLSFKVTASNVFQHDEADYGPERAFDRDAGTRWATDGGTRQAWIAVAFKEPRMVRGVRINEAFAGRVQQCEFQYRDGGAWKTIFTTAQLGRAFQRTFAPVKAQEFRLNILDASEGPTINELELF